jgi:hypothetical protein
VSRRPGANGTSFAPRGLLLCRLALLHVADLLRGLVLQFKGLCKAFSPKSPTVSFALLIVVISVAWNARASVGCCSLRAIATRRLPSLPTV